MADEIKEHLPRETNVPTEIVAQNNLANDYDIDGFLAKRKEFIEKVNAIMVEKSDYHVIQGKKSLGKGGAEKIASIFGWSAEFEKDPVATEAFSDLKGLLCFTCNLNKAGNRVGQGRGASTLAKNANDPNKTIKMAQKSAFIDAVLRASGLSDFFTQDLEDMNHAEILDRPVGLNSAITSESKPKGVSDANKDKPISEKQNKMIHALMKQKGVMKLSDIGIEKIEKPTMEDGSKIINKLLDYKTPVIREDDLPIIQIEPGDMP